MVCKDFNSISAENTVLEEDPDTDDGVAAATIEDLTHDEGRIVVASKGGAVAEAAPAASGFAVAIVNNKNNGGAAAETATSGVAVSSPNSAESVDEYTPTVEVLDPTTMEPMPTGE